MITILIAYHFLFFYSVYRDLMSLCTSETMEIFWCHWRWLGRHPFAFHDIIYYGYSRCMPFLSTFYPWHWLSAIASKRLSEDNSFKLLVSGVLFHFILASVLAYFMFRQWYSPSIALFGALTLSYMAYNIKLYNVSFLYTMAWIPGIFIKGFIGQFSLGMAILGGGWPVLIYVVPFMIMNPSCLWGVLLGLPQILPFLWYFPKSIKSNFSEVSQKFGKLKVSVLLDLLFPKVHGVINGIFYPEMAMYFGILPLMFIMSSTSKALLIAIVCMIFMFGILKVLFRAPCRFIYLFCFSLILASCNGLHNLHYPERMIYVIILIQSFCLLQNRRLINPFPFFQFQLKPSEHIARHQKNSFRYPFSTGYYFEEQTRGYTGGMCLKTTAEKFGIKDSNGEPFYC